MKGRHLFKSALLNLDVWQTTLIFPLFFFFSPASAALFWWCKHLSLSWLLPNCLKWLLLQLWVGAECTTACVCETVLVCAIKKKIGYRILQVFAVDSALTWWDVHHKLSWNSYLALWLYHIYALIKIFRLQVTVITCQPLVSNILQTPGTEWCLGLRKRKRGRKKRRRRQSSEQGCKHKPIERGGTIKNMKH